MPDHSTEPRLIAFDMDGTLIADRFIFRLARRFGFAAELKKIMSRNIPEYEKTRSVASLLKEIRVREIIDTLDQIPLSPGTQLTALELKREGHVLAIISDSYTIVTERLKKRLGFNCTVANKLVVEGGKITGEVEMPLNWTSNRTGCLKHSVCKLNALVRLSEKTKIPLERTVAVGDNIADICMLRQAGLGIAFNPKTQAVEQSADITINKHMLQLLTIIKEQRLSKASPTHTEQGNISPICLFSSKEEIRHLHQPMED
jgi:phosphoserine phosphatase SerB